MGTHDAYGKHVMQAAAGDAFTESGLQAAVSFGGNGQAHVDGIVGSEIVVEIESRVAKQVRGAVLDLILHIYPKKLLVLIPVHMHDVEKTAAQCRYILGRFLDRRNFRVVVLRGTGELPDLETDSRLVENTLRELGYPT